MISGLNYSMKKRQFSIKWLLGIVTLVAVCAAAIGMIYNSLGPRGLAVGAVYFLGIFSVAVFLFGRKMWHQARSFFRQWSEIGLAEKQARETFGSARSLAEPWHPLDD